LQRMRQNAGSAYQQKVQAVFAPRLPMAGPHEVCFVFARAALIIHNQTLLIAKVNQIKLQQNPSHSASI
jgi:hypothetical protein